MKAKRYISVILSLIMLLSSLITGSVINVNGASPESEEDLPFEDVEAGKWYYDAVRDAFEIGFMKGKSDTSFAPLDKMTRAEIVTLLSRMAGADTENIEFKNTFSDVKAGAWYAPYVSWGVTAGIVNGYNDGTFGPSKNIKRIELAALIMRFLAYMSLEIKADEEIPSGDFKDDPEIASWGKEDNYSLRKTGIIKGDSAGNFNPKGNASRAELSTIASRLIPSLTLDIAEKGEKKYTVIASDEAEDAAQRLKWQLETVTDTELEIKDDSAPESDYEIVLGKTNRGNVVDTSSFEKDGYGTEIKENRIFIDGAGDGGSGIYKGVVALLKGAKINGGLCRILRSQSVSDSGRDYPVKELKINGNSIDDYVIVCPEETTDSVKRGAADLQKYIEMTCGKKLEIVHSEKDRSIIVDPTKVKIEGSYNFSEENYSIKSEGDNIRIKGSDVRGAMYGCYAFLQNNIGWIFIADGTDYLAPCDEKDIKETDVTYTPYFEYRENYFRSAIVNQDWGAKMQLNGNTKSAEYGGGIAYTGGNCHTFGPMLGIPQSEQPCLNDEEVYEKVKAYVLNLLANNPDATLISVSQNDGGAFCTCEKCLAVAEEEGGQSGNIIRFVNRISDAIKEAGYDRVSIQTFADGGGNGEVCKTKPRDNIIIQYVCADTCFTHSIDNSKCALNSAKHAKFIRDWDSATDRIWVWDYAVHFPNYSEYCASYRYEVLAHNIRFYYENGVSGIFIEGAYNSTPMCGEFCEVKNYMQARVLQNPLMSEEEYYALMYEFLVAYFGEESAVHMKNAIDLMISKTQMCDCWINHDEDAARGKLLVVKKMLGPLGNEFRDAVLLTDTAMTWKRADIDSIQYDFINLTYEFVMNSSKKSDEEMAELRKEIYDLALKINKYGIAVSESYRYAPKFSSPDDVTYGPIDWKECMDSDGNLNTP